MNRLTKPWPLGLDGPRWWIAVAGALALVVAALTVDRPLSVWAQSWPEPVRDMLAQITDYGESAWILVPAGGLFVLTAAVALLVRWKLMRTMLWQFCALYAFIFIGVGLPQLVTTLMKRAISRGRPETFAETGLFGFRPNWLDWTHQSFPSGHATVAFALATVLGLLAPRWFWPALVLAAAVGVSRVGLGAHYPSDVIAGAIMGMLGAYLVRWLFARRGWMFVAAPDGAITARPLASLRRYLTLKRRGSASAPPPDRP